MATNHRRVQRTIQVGRKQVCSTVFTGMLIGIGTVGFLDETIFHQLLQWHSFYWATDQHGRILSDGLFHLFSTLILLWSLLRVWRGCAQWGETDGPLLVAGILIGAGGFNLYDGIIQHALLHLHLVNEHVCNLAMTRSQNTLATCPQDLPYELVWDSMGLLVLLMGIFLWRRNRHRFHHTTASKEVAEGPSGGEQHGEA